MSACITRETRIHQIKKMPEFEGYNQFLFPVDGWIGKLVGGMKLKTLAQLAKTWNADSMAAGLKYIREVQGRQKVYYDIYTDAEKNEAESRKSTGLFAFPLQKKSKFVLIAAGGGYSSVASIVEGFPTAKRLNELGYAAFVLHYRTGEDAHYPNPIEDMAKALEFIFQNQEELHVDVSDYAVMGFSAGGHLVSNYAVEKTGYGKYKQPSPGAVILSYPVISMGDITHQETRRNFLGTDEQNRELQEMFSADKMAGKEYPPTFIWCCEQDSAVLSENSRCLYRKLKENGVACKMQMYNGDAHGWGLAEGTVAEGWLEDAIRFWKGANEDEREQ